jgi:hypothetical protein
MVMMKEEERRIMKNNEEWPGKRVAGDLRFLSWLFVSF